MHRVHRAGLTRILTQQTPRAKLRYRTWGRDASRAFFRPVPAADRYALVSEFLENLDCPRALTVWLLLSAGDVESHRQLVGLTCEPTPFDTADTYARRYAATKFLSKNPTLNTGLDLKQVAIATARAAESSCKETNDRIRRYRSGAVDALGLDEGILSRIQQKISAILQSCPRPQDVGWSRGRTTSAFRDALSATMKYGSRLDVTPSCARWAVALLRDSPLWGAAALDSEGPCSVLSRGLCYVEGNVMMTVPKSAKTERIICYEPHLNIRCQLAVGSSIREGLRRHGVNLNDQSVNQRRAKLGSKTGHLATLDLSAASDTISKELVWLLLPYDWASMLDDLRSKTTLWLDTNRIETNEKFASMGCGFTFELESLIFYAASMAVCGSNVSVYGDDIIIPSEHYREVVLVLQALGFSVNTAKSYSEGNFRESCGFDAFGGHNVTPVYLRSALARRGDVIQLHNAIRAWCSRTGNTEHFWAATLRSWRARFPFDLGPEGFGDGHYHTNLDEAQPDRIPSFYGWDGWVFCTLNRVYLDNPWESVDGAHVPRRHAWGALAASTGPKRTFDVVRAESRGRYTVVLSRTATSQLWPVVLWTS